MKRFLLFATLLCSLLCQAQTNYDFSRLEMEKLGRGVVAVRQSPEEVFVSWRYLGDDPSRIAFNVYRDGRLLNDSPIKDVCWFVDTNSSSDAAVYEVQPVSGKAAGGSFTLPANAPEGYLPIAIEAPAPQTMPDGQVATYSPNDCSIGDVDGDGEYEIFLKWDPSNSHDNAHRGYTGTAFIDCMKLDGTRLWRIDLGRNIRAGAHYTQFMVYDLDGDGQAEVVMKTADGTVDGCGKVIGDGNADYRETGKNQGRILSGPEYLTVFDGRTGAALHTTGYVPPRGDPKGWGDSWGNRSDRYLACVAYLDGRRPSVVMCRGYYTRIVLAAFDWDGETLRQRWVFDSDTPGNGAYAGQGNHNLRVADVDGDGCDEIVYGSCTIDHDGKGLYSTGLGHGDALHLTQFDPNHSGLQVWACHENRRDGSTLRDAATGKILFQIPAHTDVGRCMAADITPCHPGVEMWSSASGGLRGFRGEVIAEQVPGLPVNMAVWWDGDLLRELLDKNCISKYDWHRKRCEVIARFDGCDSNNGTKATPCLQADLVGDWREEVLVRTADNRSLRLYVTGIPTPYRFHTFLEDPVYRLSIVTENVGYNQPTQPGFYFGPDLKGTFRGFVFSR